MVLNALHFVSIVSAFVLIVFGYSYVALIPFFVALAMTFFIYRVKRTSRKSDAAANTENQRNETAETLTRVLLNRRHGNQKGVKEYWQQTPKDDITGIKIDKSSQTGKRHISPVPIFWLLFVVGVIVWGAYNIVMHDSLYVPLSRIYEKTQIPDKSYQSIPIPRASSDVSAADELKQRTVPLPPSEEENTILPNTTITQEMLDNAWGALKTDKSAEQAPSKAVEPEQSTDSKSGSGSITTGAEDKLSYYYAIQLKTGERIITKTAIIHDDAVDYIDRTGHMTSIDRSLIESLMKYYYRNKN